jgi:alkylated DNA nucleotide flippase Atl1
MDVKEATLQEILEGTKQYLVPMYQRPYAWKSSNWNKLWQDIVALAEARETNPAITHFTGTLVLDTSTVNPSITQFVVVDGQQRLTTLNVLLASIAHERARHGDAEACTEIVEQFLINKWSRVAAERYRLKPANFDEPVYRDVVEGNEPHSTTSLIDDAYHFFKKQLAQLQELGLSLDRVQDAALRGLKFVTITAKSDDNVYRIFESINNTGIRLTQADLIRNFVFMKLGEEGEFVHESLWLPILADLSSDDIETLFWIEAQWRNPDVRKFDVYEAQKQHLEKLSSREIVDYLKNVLLIADALRVLRRQAIERHSELARRVERFALWQNPSALVLAARIIYLRNANRIDSHDAAEAFRVMESYLIRRYLLAVPVGTLGRVFAPAAHEMHENASTWLHTYLSTGRKRYIPNAEVGKAVLESPIYGRGRRDQLTLILAWILEAKQGKDIVDFSTTTIEHVLPQNMSSAACEEFEATLTSGQEVVDMHDSLVHTLGNLTLTNHNSELGNKPFSVKRVEWLSKTAIRENQIIAENPQWGHAEITARAEEIASIVIREWPGPDESLAESEPMSIGNRVDEVVSVVSAGRWTTYGDIAQVLGTSSQYVGTRVSREGGPEGAWRVLRSNGTVAPEFRWTDGSPFQGRSGQDVLESEGVVFDERGCALEIQRLTAEDLRGRLGEVSEEENE